jgi:ubiquinone/menaquinone biosynthesis C-methylase UbiE
MDDRVTGWGVWQQFTQAEIPSTLTLNSLLSEHLQPSQPIIDIACGSGSTSLALLSGGFGPVLGIDLNVNAVQAARSRVTSDTDRVPADFVVCDAREICFGDGSFFCAILQATLTILSPHARLAVLQEARRIVDASGGLYLAEFLVTPDREYFARRYRLGLGETGERNSFNVYSTSGHFLYRAHHFLESELYELLDKSNFKVEQAHFTRVRTRSGNVANGLVIWAH